MKKIKKTGEIKNEKTTYPFFRYYADYDFMCSKKT